MRSYLHDQFRVIEIRMVDTLEWVLTWMKCMGEASGVIKMFFILTGMVIREVYTYIKMHQAVHLRLVLFAIF